MGNGGWNWGLGDVRRVLYRLPDLLKAVEEGQTIYVCEGEKDVDRSHSVDLVATCNPGGAGKWKAEYSEFLLGADVVIIADNDAAGQSHAQAVAASLYECAARVRVLDLSKHWPECPSKGDISDWFDAGGTVDVLNTMVDTLPDWRPPGANRHDWGAVNAETRAFHQQVAAERRAANGGGSGKEGDIILSCAADVMPQPIGWVWRGRIALGKLTLISGDPGLAKSQISLDLHARQSRGAKWPDSGHAPMTNGIILSAEDGAADTLRPRLEAANADLGKVWIVSAVQTTDSKLSFSLQQDLQALGRRVDEIGNVGMITIDPITSYMGKIDSHRTTDVRHVLEPLAAFAEEKNVAILAVSHPPKATQTKALHAVTGSLAFVAAARMVFVVVEEPETGRRLFLPTKNNLAPMPAGLAYRVEQRMVSGDNIVASHIVWDDAPVTVTANQALAADREHAGGGSDLREAKDYLRETLANGPRPAKDVQDEAEAMGISERTLKRAKAALRVKAEKDGFRGRWSWSLP